MTAAFHRPMPYDHVINMTNAGALFTKHLIKMNLIKIIDQNTDVTLCHVNCFIGSKKILSLTTLSYCLFVFSLQRSYSSGIRAT